MVSDPALNFFGAMKFTFGDIAFLDKLFKKFCKLIIRCGQQLRSSNFRNQIRDDVPGHLMVELNLSLMDDLDCSNDGALARYAISISDIPDGDPADIIVSYGKN